jgi:hypothetical protein
MSEKKNKKDTYESMQEANAHVAAVTDEKGSRKKKKDIHESMHEANEQMGGR